MYCKIFIYNIIKISIQQIREQEFRELNQDHTESEQQSSDANPGPA